MLGIAHRKDVNATVRNVVAFVNYIERVPHPARAVEGCQLIAEAEQSDGTDGLYFDEK